MRVTAMVLLALATPAHAEGWEVMYLADSGGSRPMVVAEGEGSPQAFVVNGAGQRLFVDCRPAEGGYDWALRVFAGDAGGAGEGALVARIGPAAVFDLGPVSAAQGTLAAPIPREVVATMTREATISILIDGRTLADFTLAGFAAAIDRACPAD